MIVTGETESTKEQEQAKNQGTVRHTLKAMDGKLGLDEVGKNKHSWGFKEMRSSRFTVMKMIKLADTFSVN